MRLPRLPYTVNMTRSTTQLHHTHYQNTAYTALPILFEIQHPPSNHTSLPSHPTPFLQPHLPTVKQPHHGHTYISNAQSPSFPLYLPCSSGQLQRPTRGSYCTDIMLALLPDRTAHLGSTLSGEQKRHGVAYMWRCVYVCKCVRMCVCVCVCMKR